MSYRVLLVDEDQEIIELFGSSLEKEGFLVKYCNRGKNALKIALDFSPHVIILDVLMAEMDGIETCLRLRDRKELEFCAISFLSTRDEDYTQIAALDAGADDYMVKPIKPRLFVSRIKALVRRLESHFRSIDRLETPFGKIKIDKERFVVIRDGNKISLPKKEFELLEYLASKPGKVFTREEIFTNIWEGGFGARNRTIDVHIRKLRLKIGEEQIKTVKGIGYKLTI